MSFSPIYKNFQHLLTENSGIFKLFNKTKNPGMFQALWQARQAEVDTYKERLKQTEKKLGQVHDIYAQENRELHRKIKDLQAILMGHAQTANSLKNKLKTTDLEFGGIKEEATLLKSESQRLAIENETLKVETSILQKEQLDLMSEKDRLARELSKTHEALLKTHERQKVLINENEELNLENDGLNIKLEKSKHYAKEFRRINGRMENELHRINHELERAQSLM